MPTKPAGKKKFYCDMHGQNKTHDTTMQNEADKVIYKDLNAFVNTKVTVTFNKVEKNLKKRKDKEVKLNVFDKFCSLNVESSDEKDKPNKHAPTNVDNDDSSASCLLSNDSNSDIQ